MKRGIFDSAKIDEINEKTAEWEKNRYGGRRQLKNKYKTLSGFDVKPLYTPGDVVDFDYLQDLGYPGEGPFTRGVHPTMYRGRTWTHRQLAGFGPPEETNKRYKFLLQQGATGINGVFDYPTLRGYDSDDKDVYADVGRGGVAIDTVEDMRILFDGIPIDEVSVSLVTCQPICNISIQSMYFANAGDRGIPLTSLAGTSQNDFLLETAITVAPGVLPPRASFKVSCDAIEFCTRHAPRWNPISFAGYNYREAGCTAPQEVAFVIAHAVACSEEMLRRGLPVDSFAGRLSFFLSAHNDFFEEIAKYRAARRVYYNIMRQRFKAEDPRSLMFRFHVQTAGVALTAQQPLNNIARSAYHALAAVLGGAQSVHVDAYDEALCTPTELSSVTALRTQQILQNETGVINTIDPLGGSYYLESLTDRMEAEVLKILDEIEGKGGLVSSVESGWIHAEISDAAYKYQCDIESGEMPIVGVNCFQIEDEVLPIELFSSPETLKVQKEKLRRIREKRDPRKVQKSLDAVARCCERNENLMELIVGEVKNLITEGEISRTLKRVYGVWEPPLF
ncbi:MAG TPA: methylmalonyl-CoA mutase family protein [Syntrophales bacterium]|nr:methylmalonyl-CoA mutase family protein [Syntrophales bacterium]